MQSPKKIGSAGMPLSELARNKFKRVLTDFET
jgi:hypothetical protein